MSSVGGDWIAKRVSYDFYLHSRLDAYTISIICTLGCDYESWHNIDVLINGKSGQKDYEEAKDKLFSDESFNFLFTDSSVSAKYCLLSEWPIITYSHPTDFNISPETSPV